MEFFQDQKKNRTRPRLFAYKGRVTEGRDRSLNQYETNI